jgi:hypothetical protein
MATLKHLPGNAVMDEQPTDNARSSIPRMVYATRITNWPASGEQASVLFKLSRADAFTFQIGN